MGKIYFLFTTFLLVSLFSFPSVFGQTAEKISLTPSMVTNESPYGDPSMLVDEQSIAGDPLNGTGGAPKTNWFPGWGDRHPVSAYIDLGVNYKLSNVFLYDNNSKADFIVEYGAPGNWMPLFIDPLQYYQVWVDNEVDVSTRYLRFTRTTAGSNMHEVVLYGSPVNLPPVLNAIEPQTITEGESHTLTLSAVDDDNDIPTYSLSPSAGFITLTDSGNGTANIVMSPGSGDAGSYAFTVKVDDGKGGTDEKTFDLNVSPQTVNVPGKIVLNPSMLTNESSYGDPGMLVDEQALAGDPLNGTGGAPKTNWFPGWGDIHPVSAYIDLGGVYKLSNVFLYDNNGKGEFVVEHGSPGNWMPLFTDPLNFYQVWVNKEVDASTRYLRFTRVSESSNLHEVLGNLKKLKKLWLYSNEFSGQLPVSFGGLDALKDLRVFNNDLEGAVPELINQLNNLIYLSLSRNKLTTFPNFSSHQNKNNLTLDASNNSFSFKDIEQNLTGPNTHLFTSFTYNGQSQRPNETVQAVENSPLTLTSDDNAPHNHYQWQKNINDTWTDIEGATAISYTIPSVTEAGQYRCRLTNDWVTGMTLYSQTYEVELTEPPTSFAENRPNDEAPPQVLGNGRPETQQGFGVEINKEDDFTDQTKTINYVRTYSPRIAIKDEGILVTSPVEDVHTSTQYIDGLGRPVQTVIKGESPMGRDIIHLLHLRSPGKSSVRHSSRSCKANE